MAALFDLFDTKIRSVVECSLSTRVNQGQLVRQRIAVSELCQQIRALVEADQEEVVITVTGLDERSQCVSRAVKLAFHTAGHIEDDSQANRYVIIAEVRDFLFDLVLEYLEVVLIKSGYQSVVRVGNRDRQRDKLSANFDALLVIA